MNKIKFCPLFSGSDGNCIFISYKSTKLLIDCGKNFKQINNALKAIDEDINKVDAIFITHCHNDHTAALPVILKNTQAKVCTTLGTLNELYQKENFKSVMNTYNDKIFQMDESQSIGVLDMVVSSFGVPHDAPQTVGYNITADSKSISILTDVGYLRENLFSDVSGKELVFLESNHDLFSLENCSYPMSLKQRILSNGGHLSNDNCGKFSSFLVDKGVEKIILGHLSGEANTPQMAYDTVSQVLKGNDIKVDKDVALNVSPRGEQGAAILI